MWSGALTLVSWAASVSRLRRDRTVLQPPGERDRFSSYASWTQAVLLIQSHVHQVASERASVTESGEAALRRSPLVSCLLKVSSLTSVDLRACSDHVTVITRLSTTGCLKKLLNWCHF